MGFYFLLTAHYNYSVNMSSRMSGGGMKAETSNELYGNQKSIMRN